MGSLIRVLTEQTINQIAAGEVIENPASVVKELVENSLDAGATEIAVEIHGGGRQLIRVRDNGRGMNPDDALLCLERHATSKIRSVEDLQELASMGFRGEALPSIASISHFTLITAPQEGGGKGTLVHVEGGKILKCAPVEASLGTLIEVKSLFHNVPARKKFQKSPTHDTQEILKWITLLALSHPTITLELISNQKRLLKACASKADSFQELLGKRIEELLGRDFFQELTPLELTRGNVQLRGFIGQPIFTRHNRAGQYLFINQRAVTSPLISYAIRAGYGPSLPPNRHPLFVLHLAIPGEMVDVNVHPQKREVRLRHEQAIKEMLMRAVEGAFKESYREPVAPFSMTPQQPIPFEPPFRESSPTEIFYAPPITRSSLPPLQETPRLFETAPAPKKSSLQKSSLRVLTTRPGYIVLESPASESLSLLDQRAAHGRIIYEKLCRAEEAPLQIQNLLIPYQIEVTPLEGHHLKQHLDKLNRLGIAIREFGGQTFLVDALPQIFGNSDVGALLRALLDRMPEWSEEGSDTLDSRLRIAQIASQSAVSRQRRLTLEEAEHLVQQLMACDSPFQCPQGKPTFVHIPFETLLKQFGRS